MEDVAPTVLLPAIRVVSVVARLWDESTPRRHQPRVRDLDRDVSRVPVSCTSTGIGAPSTSIAVEELARVGATTFLRIGTCGTFLDHVQVGDMAIFDSAVRLDGASRAYAPIEFPAVASHDVVTACIRAGDELRYRSHVGTTRSADTFYARHPGPGSSFADYWQSDARALRRPQEDERDRGRDGGQRDLRPRGSGASAPAAWPWCSTTCSA